MWTISQRRALIAVVFVAAVALGVQRYLHPVAVDFPDASDGVRSSELSGKIDPNTASAAELATLPDLGRAKAQALVAYRDQFQAAHPGEIAFRREDDLTNVKGIGQTMSRKLAQYLYFPTANADKY